MTDNGMVLGKAWLWPPVDTRRQALATIHEAFLLCFAMSLILLLFTFVDLSRSPANFDVRRLIVPFFYASIAFGIRGKSRVAGILGLSLYLVSELFWPAWFRPGGLVLTVVIGFALLHGVRGTLAFHRIATIPEGTPDLKQSVDA